MFNISTQSDYGMLMISYLNKKTGFIPISELVEKMKLPQRYLARIAAVLAKHNVLESREGKIGGYKLANSAKNMNLYDYLRIFEGDMAITRCQSKDYACKYDKVCRHNGMLRSSLATTLTKQLKKQKLLSLFD